MDRPKRQPLAFDRPAAYWTKKAQDAAAQDDVLRALKLLRQAQEKDPSHRETGMTLAGLLWEEECYHASLRECARVLAYHPGDEAALTLLRKNLHRMGQHEAAEASVTPGETLPVEDESWSNPSGAKEPRLRRRFAKLLGRAERAMDKGRLETANRLLVHARHGAFQRWSIRREAADIRLLALSGMMEEAAEKANAMMDGCEMSGEHLLGLLPVLDTPENGPLGLRMFEYALTEAVQTNEFFAAITEAVHRGEWAAAVHVLEDTLQEAPYRLDVLYDLGIVYLYMGQLDEAYRQMKLCYEIDPYDVDAHYMCQLLLDMRSRSIPAESLFQREFALPMYGAENSHGKMMGYVNIFQTLSEGEAPLLAQELKRSLLTVNQLMCVIGSHPQMGIITAAAATLLGNRHGAALVRLALLTANPDEQLQEILLCTLHLLGDHREALVLADGWLSSRKPVAGALESRTPRQRRLYERSLSREKNETTQPQFN